MIKSIFSAAFLMIFVINCQKCKSAIDKNRATDKTGADTSQESGGGESKTPEPLEHPEKYIPAKESIPKGPVANRGSCGATLAEAVVSFDIDVSAEQKWISKYIYGANMYDWLQDPWKGAQASGWTLLRAGGNNWSTYNWEIDSHNVGQDGCGFEKCDFNIKGDPNTPGARVTRAINLAFKHNAAVLVTVPIIGKVSSTEDKGFFTSKATKAGSLELAGNRQDRVVYQQEYVNWIEKTHRSTGKPPIFYSLDNEPALWYETHPTAHPGKVTYQELLERSIEYAQMIKATTNDALVFGPALWGWHAYTTLQDAPDQNGRIFIDFYLEQMRKAHERTGKRLLDVLDLHWYTFNTEIQSPRSLWDKDYREHTWIDDDVLNEPVRLLPRLKERIAAYYPGTKISISEYTYKDGTEIKGAIKQADVLGIFGKEGVYAATLWSLNDHEDPFFHGAFAMYRNYDRKGGKFGDISIKAQNSDFIKTSVYASYDSTNNNIVIIAINKSSSDIVAGLKIHNAVKLSGATAYKLTANSPLPKEGGVLNMVQGCGLSYKMPANSVSTLVLK